ncbi:hypothetical protein [Flavobacterium sp. C4GT6]|uniref:hypothetical protein n=1 Tax=Flavobacterium sp. C4GT6 TaxID=3103818 RepID=UPI002ED08EE9
MKRFFIFTLLLANSFVFKLSACWFYPYGENVRYCFLHSGNVGYDTYSFYNYTSEWNYYADTYDGYGFNLKRPNIELWQQYCDNKISYVAIEKAVYKLSMDEVRMSSNNAMLRYLYAKGDTDAIDYLKFAKSVEVFSSYSPDDAWEKKPVDNDAAKLYIDKLLKKADEVKNEYLRDRYLFLAVRTAYYTTDGTPIIREVFEKQFSQREKKDLIYYWVLHFNAMCENNPAKANFMAAQVFANAPDKRVAATHNCWDKNIPIEEVLQYAKTKDEIANTWLIYGVRRTAPALSYLQNIYDSNPAANGFGFMLLREVNKLEDWILTPQYSLFLPSVRQDFWENSNTQRILNRVDDDRMYACDLLSFVSAIDLSEVDNPYFIKLSKCYLEFLVKDYGTALYDIAQLRKQLPTNSSLNKSLDLIEGLVLTAYQDYGSAVVPEKIKTLVIKELRAGNGKYIFAIGRELEERGNTTMAAFLFSKLKDSDDSENYLYYSTNQQRSRYVTWKSKNGATTSFDDYYYDYLSYIDAAYTIPQMQDFLAAVTNKQTKLPFDNWIYEGVNGDLNELYNITGMKYLRKNDLQGAYSYFKLMSTEQDGFESDPFMKLRYTDSFSPVETKQKFTKAVVIKKLIEFLEKANNVNEKDRDYYYFLVANCYYNMTYKGTVWNMKRRVMTDNQHTNLEDDKEYYNAILAAEYYKLAMDNAKTDKFKALCLRMIGMCNEDHKYTELKEQYPKAYDDLTSNCTRFSDYFKARR